MNFPVWPVMVLLVLAAVREVAREFPPFLLTKIRYTLTRSSPGTRGAPSVSLKGTPSCHISPCGQSDPSGNRTRSLPSAAVQERKPHAGSGGGPSLGAPMANPVNVCRSSAVLLCVNELWGVQI